MRFVLLSAMALALCSCASELEGATQLPTPPAAGEPGEGSAAGGEDNTYDHEGTQVDVWSIIEQLQAEGPLKYSARVHGCAKIRYATLGAVLSSRGVDTAAEGGAGAMYRNSSQALGAPNFAARSREASAHTSASAQRMFDIFLSAAPEVIASMPTLEACTAAGVPTNMFDGDGNCTADGVACLLGFMPSAGHLEICNKTITEASSPDKGRAIAVAAMLSAAHTCE